MQLSKRLYEISQMVTKGNRLVDIGTDHGYIPIYLVKYGEIPSALAMDINKGPILRAYEHIKENGLEDKIETRLSDGLCKYSKGEGDSVIIAGMGGALTVKILTEGKDKLEGISELILSPQSEIFLVREYLQRENYIIIEEKMVFDEGKYYTIIKAVEGKDSNTYSEFEMEYGYVLIKNRDEVFKQFLIKEREKYQNIVKRLKDNPSEISKKRRKIMISKISEIDDVLEKWR